MNKHVRKIVLSALFVAMSCVATMVVQIPSPIGGYVNLGDSIVILAGYMLGSFYGSLSAGIGSMFADIFTGYAYYAPATLIIKGAMAALASILFCPLRKRFKKCLPALLISGVCAGILMVAGYFLYAALFLGYGLAAFASVPGNISQAAFGVTVSSLFYLLLVRSKYIKRFLDKIDC